MSSNEYNIYFIGVGKQSSTGTKPRLVRQQAVQEESSDIACSPPRLGVRFLPTIPSAADSSVILDDESNNEAGTPFYTVFQSGNTLTTLSSPTKSCKSKNTKPP